GRGPRRAGQRGNRQRPGPPHLRPHPRRLWRPARRGPAHGRSRRPRHPPRGPPRPPRQEAGDHVSTPGTTSNAAPEEVHASHPAPPPARREGSARLLLRAYPPAYREERGEEMIGTMLEATPEGQDWPSVRDSWSLLAGGLKARAAVNRQVPVSTAVRQAAVLG